MTSDKRKTEPPLYLDMDFEETLSRFARVKPDEVRESIERSKQKKPPGEKPARRRPKKEGSS
ncbi:MAG: hypothetical protein RID15_08330 [Marinovum algicola]|uniref:Uncharacterized protein n=1 Tax=Marinovum algicola TaxID=42444 RepID=A0A975W9T7_9RHOB|nr:MULTISPECIES: hypothetical protein [Marinovum]MDD9739152.1 hypothetical protein [Marinovum sp. SP66]SEJ42094.1 hypothetical protein SAMN04487940_105291 [Marinovum algicola]SLN41589.1 hypothetical protein MAA5396_02037 [Marinovum algicola]